MIIDHVCGYKNEIINFLKELIAIPSEGGNEKDAIELIYREMKKNEFDGIRIDGMGNIIGRIGTGERVIAFDGHVDTVAVGDINRWERNPYGDVIENRIIYGRGAVDQKGGIASMLYAGKVIKDLKLYKDFSLYFVGSVQEESYEGLNWEYIIQKEKLKPEVVVITEPSNLKIHRGHRGRVEIIVKTKGVSSHASTPEMGENSIYKIMTIVNEIMRLNERLKEDSFLGKGTVVVTHIENKTCSRNTIPEETMIFLDRRLSEGETKETALQEVRDAIRACGVSAEVKINTSRVENYTGLVQNIEDYYPVWVIPADHYCIDAAVKTMKSLFDEPPSIDRWLFNTNAAIIGGKYGIPCLGFGPGNEAYAHTVDEKVPVDHLLKAASFYATFPGYLPSKDN